MQNVAKSQSFDQVERWAAAASTGDTDAMGMLYERYVDAIFRFVYVRTQDRTVTEDVCSEVWLRVVRAIPDYTASGNGFPAWLYTIARNSIMDTFRRSTRKPETPTGDMLNLDSPSMEVGPEEAAIRTHVATELAKHLAKLPAKQSQCVTLRFFEGLTVAETASVMGVSTNVVKSTQHRALKALAKILPNEMRILGGSLCVSPVRIVDAGAANQAVSNSR